MKTTNLSLALLLVAGSSTLAIKQEAFVDQLEGYVVETNYAHSVPNEDGTHAMNGRELFILGLQYPTAAGDRTKLEKMAEDERKWQSSFDYYTKECPIEDQVKMFRFDTEEKIDVTDFEKFKTENAALYSKLNAQVIEKGEALRSILLSNQSVKDIYNGTEDFDLLLKSHIDNFIANAVVFDAKRQNFGDLHKALEGLASIFEVQRKAKAAVDKIEKILSSKDAVVSRFSADQTDLKFKIKTEKPTNLFSMFSSDDKKDDKTKAKPVNLISEAIKAANSSTSCSQSLFFTFAAAHLLAAWLLFYKAFYSIAEKGEDLE